MDYLKERQMLNVKCQRTNSAYNKLNKLIGLISIAMLFTTAMGETQVLEEEQLITELSLDAKSYAHFVMKVTK